MRGITSSDLQLGQSTVTSTPPLATPRLAPLYLAGFTTAFGAHGIAAALEMPLTSHLHFASIST